MTQRQSGSYGEFKSGHRFGVIVALLVCLGAPQVAAEEAISEQQMVLDYYLPLAKGGEPYAQLTLGEMLYEGRGVERDWIQAYAWLLLSRQQGVEDAQPLLSHLNNKLTPEQRHQAESLVKRYGAADR